MQATFNAVRAIGAEFARRTLQPFTIAGAILAVVLLAFGGWLTTLSVWWWILESLFIAGTLVFVTLVLIIRFMVRLADTPQTKQQKRAVKSYVGKLQRVADNMHVSQFVVLYRVVRDTVRPRPGGFIETVSHDSKTLAPDFAALVKLFS